MIGLATKLDKLAAQVSSPVSKNFPGHIQHWTCKHLAAISNNQNHVVSERVNAVVCSAVALIFHD